MVTTRSEPRAVTLPRPARAKWADAVIDRLSQQPVRKKDPWRNIRQGSAAVAIALLPVLLSRPPKQGRETQAELVRRWGARLLYAMTVVNPCFSVLANDYTFIRDAASSFVRARKRRGPLMALANNQEEKLRQLSALRPCYTVLCSV